MQPFVIASPGAGCTRKRGIRRVRPRGALALIAVLLAACTGSGDPVESATPATSDSALAIHGDWVVEVLAIDGSVANTVEFSNALSSEGALELAHLLVGETTGAGTAVLAIAHESDLELACEPGHIAETGVCVSIPDDCGDDEVVSGDACIERALADNHDYSEDGKSVTFTGQESRNEPWTVYGVQTYLREPGQRFTMKPLDEPVDVEAHQIVNLTVELSFG